MRLPRVRRDAARSTRPVTIRWPELRRAAPAPSPPMRLDRQINELAARQHGIVSRTQLLQLDMRDDAILRRVDRGWLRRVHRGVYAVGQARPSDHGRWMAGVLALGSRCDPTAALLSHRSAAALHGLLPPQVHAAVEVTCLTSRKSISGIRAHRSRRFDDIGTIRDGIPCTTVARTLVDLAAGGNAAVFDRAWSSAASRRILRRADVLRELRADPTRPGSRLVLAALDRSAPYLGQRTRSNLERLALRVCHDFDLPRPYANRELRIGDRTYEADLLWSEPRLVVEVDGDDTHGNPVARENDRRRDADLQLAGWKTIRIGWSELAHEPAAVAERLRAAIAQPPLEPVRTSRREQ